MYYIIYIYTYIYIIHVANIYYAAKLPPGAKLKPPRGQAQRVAWAPGFRRSVILESWKNLRELEWKPKKTWDLGLSRNGATPIAGWFIRENSSRMDDDWG